MIKLNIKRTNITASCLETLVEGNVTSVFAEFIFSPEWDNLTRIAIFSNGTSKVSVSLSENTCAIPWEMLSCPGELLVAIRGIGNGGNLVICTENASLGKVTDSLADDDAAAPEEASPNVIDTLISDVADLKSSGGNGKSAYELAVDAGFVGTQEQWLESLHGADGINGADGYTPSKGVDYWTAADKVGIVNDVLNEIPTIPTQLSQLTGDSTHRVVTDTEKAAWNGKQNAINFSRNGDHEIVAIDGVAIAATSDADGNGISATYAMKNELNGKQDTIDASHKLPYAYISGTPTIPTVPTNVSAFTNDSGYLTLATLPIYNGGVS